MREPVGDEKGAVLGEIAVVEDQDEFAAVGPEALNRMRNAAGEEPEIALLDVGDDFARLGIDAGDAAHAVSDEGPFGGNMPVQLAHGARGQPHVDAGHRLGNREVAHRDLARPACGGMAVVDGRERARSVPRLP